MDLPYFLLFVCGKASIFSSLQFIYHLPFISLFLINKKMSFAINLIYYLGDIFYYLLFFILDYFADRKKCFHFIRCHWLEPRPLKLVSCTNIDQNNNCWVSSVPLLKSRAYKHLCYYSYIKMYHFEKKCCFMPGATRFVLAEV